MIERYSREEMAKIWTLESKFQYYLNVEIAVCEAYAELGEIPKEDVLIIKQVENQHTINMLHKHSTNKSCDFIIFRVVQNKLIAYFCEIKSSYNE